MKISSRAFPANGTIPVAYTMNGANMNPPLHIEGVPAGARSLALEVDDPDAPNGSFNHWVLFNIHPATTDLRENASGIAGVAGQNDFGDLNYDGPKPPDGRHHYHFKVFALDTVLNLPPGAKRAELDHAMAGHVLDQAEVVGTYAPPHWR